MVHTTLHELEAEWTRFQTAQSKNSGDSEVSYGDELVQYQKLKNTVQDASAEWEKRRAVYLAQLDQPTAHTSASQSPLPELIEAHRTLSTNIRELSEKPNVSMEELMERWCEFHTVHQTLMMLLRADEK